MKISVQKEASSKIQRLCIPKTEIEPFLRQLGNYRRLFKFTKFYDSVKLTWEKRIILIMVAAAANHPCFSMESPQPEIDTIFKNLTTNDVLLARFMKALQFFGYLITDQQKIKEIEMTTEDWNLAKALRYQDSTMGASKNELLLTRHSIFLFTNVTTEFS